MKKNEIVIFETDDKCVTLPVRMDEETVWLNRNQMAELFDTTKQNISLHISNCFKDKEIDKDSVVKYYLTTAKDGVIGKTAAELIVSRADAIDILELEQLSQKHR